MKDSIKVSVIVPVYNSQDYIEQCVNSLVNQTLREIEIICVDDGSTDRSLSILNRFAADDPRIIVKKQCHKDAGTARNLGLGIARGKYLAFLDADDYFEPEALATSFQVMETELSDVLVYGGREFHHVTGESMEMTWGLRLQYCPGHFPFSPSEMANYIFNSFQNWPWNKMFRHSFVREKRLKFQEIERTNDMLFVTLALALANRISVVNQIFVNHRIGTGSSLQQTNDKTPLAFWDAFKETKKGLEEAGVYQKYEQSYLNAVLGLTFYNLRSVKHTEAYRDILALLKYRAEDEFGFMKRPVSDYYYLNELAEYCRLKGKIKIGRGLSEEPKITVVIPSLNSRKYIRECLESILEQTLDEIEILCVDAGSNDGTLQILQEYAAMDRRVRVVCSEKKSYGYQINLGIRAAHGKYLMIVESDDYILPDACREVFTIAEKNNVEVLRADYRVFIGEKNNHRTAFKKVIANNSLYGKNTVPVNALHAFSGSDVPWSGLYNVKFLRENEILLNNTEGASFQGTGLWFQCLSFAQRVFFYNKSFYRWRGDNPESAIYSKNKVFCMCDEYDYIRQCIKKKKNLEEKLAPVCAYNRFNAYLLTLGRIAEEYKLGFLKRFAADFKKIEASGELDVNLFPKEQWEKLHRIMKDPQAFYFSSFPITYGFWRCLEPKYYPLLLKRWYRENTKKELDLEHPQTFNEKIQWLKLYDSTHFKTQLSDQVAVRVWAGEKIGTKYLIPTLGVWDAVDKIDFDSLPQQFVMKASHGKEWRLAVPDKNNLDYKKARKVIETWLNKNYALCNGLELQYSDIYPQVLAEQYLGDEKELVNYSFFCFGGQPDFVIVKKLFEDNTEAKKVFDLNWEPMPVRFNDKTKEAVFEKPAFYDMLLHMVKILCADFNFVCVEFCSVKEKLYFNAMDFTPNSGIIQWDPAEKNLEYGTRIDLLLNERSALPEKSFIEKGIPRLTGDFIPPKTDEEIRQEIMKQKDREILLKKNELKKKNEEIEFKNVQINEKCDRIVLHEKTIKEKEEVIASLQYEIEERNKEIENLKSTNVKMEEVLNSITHSKSFVIGEVLTKPAKKLKAFFGAK